MDISKSNFCRVGLGVGSPQCQKGEPSEPKKQSQPGPNVAGEIAKVGQCSCGKLSLIIPDSVKTKADLSKFLEEQGYKRGTDEYWNFYKEYSINFKEYYR